MQRKKFKNNFKRRVSFGFVIITLLVAVIFVGLSGESYAGCSGDCMSCHPKLKDSKDHQSLKTCITCHNPDKPRLKMTLNLNPGAADGCGDRCFTCHNAWPQDSYHVSLETCMNCHEK